MLISGLADFPPTMRGGVIAIGNFDGVHAGHRAVIGQAAKIAAEKGVPVGVMTFEPHPRTVFRPEAPVFRLTPRAEKRLVLAACGVGMAIEVDFDKAFAAHSADDFVRAVLVAALGAGHVVVGFDFQYGKGRAGTADTLRAAGQALGFGVTVIPPHSSDGDAPISSSAIRDALAGGDIDAARDGLGYRWFVSGPVIHGEKRGRALGYPTANMRLGQDCRLAHGVYAVRMKISNRVIPGVASYGRRPQFDNGAPLLETFLFDFSDDLYGQTVLVEFAGYLRPEMAFETLDGLITQMDEDSLKARSITDGIAAEPFGLNGL